MGRGESYRGQQFADRNTNLLPGRRPSSYRQQQQNTNMQALGAIRPGGAGGGGYRRERE
jgi:hypothetical protein